LDDDDQRQLALVIMEHVRTRADPRGPVDVHTLSEDLAARLKLEKDEVADAIVRHCDALSVPMMLRIATPRRDFDE
jgi:hypothetical protein